MEIRQSSRKHGSATADTLHAIDESAKVEETLDTLSPATPAARDATAFRRIIAARQGVEDANNELHEAVAAARRAGDSWTIIGVALDTTRQAAFQRFGG